MFVRWQRAIKMKTKLLYGAVLVSSAMLVACGGSSSNEPDKGKPDPVEDKGPSITDPIDKNPIEKNDPPGDKEPSKIIDLTKTNEGFMWQPTLPWIIACFGSILWGQTLKCLLKK